MSLLRSCLLLGLSDGYLDNSGCSSLLGGSILLNDRLRALHVEGLNLVLKLGLISLLEPFLLKRVIINLKWKLIAYLLLVVIELLPLRASFAGNVDKCDIYITYEIGLLLTRVFLLDELSTVIAVQHECGHGSLEEIISGLFLLLLGVLLLFLLFNC
jgi:hypothetical protein